MQEGKLAVEEVRITDTAISHAVRAFDRDTVLSSVAAFRGEERGMWSGTCQLGHKAAVVAPDAAMCTVLDSVSIRRGPCPGSILVMTRLRCWNEASNALASFEKQTQRKQVGSLAKPQRKETASFPFLSWTDQLLCSAPTATCSSSTFPLHIPSFYYSRSNTD